MVTQPEDQSLGCRNSTYYIENFVCLPSVRVAPITRFIRFPEGERSRAAAAASQNLGDLYSVCSEKRDQLGERVALLRLWVPNANSVAIESERDTGRFDSAKNFQHTHSSSSTSQFPGSLARSETATVQRAPISLFVSRFCAGTVVSKLRFDQSLEDTPRAPCCAVAPEGIERYLPKASWKSSSR